MSLLGFEKKINKMKKEKKNVLEKGSSVNKVRMKCNTLQGH